MLCKRRSLGFGNVSELPLLSLFGNVDKLEAYNLIGPMGLRGLIGFQVTHQNPGTKNGQNSQVPAGESRCPETRL